MGERLPTGPSHRARPAWRRQRHLPGRSARSDHPSSPCEQTKLPRKIRRQVVPLPVEAVTALASTVPPRYRTLVVLCAGTGLRQGEAFGLTQDRVNFLKRCLTVDRRLIGQDHSQPRFGPPKTAASARTVPLPDVVAEALAEHLRVYGTGPEGLLFVDDDGFPLLRPRFSSHVWRPVVAAAEAAPHGTGMHELRHFYASLLIRHGESVKTVQSRPGQARRRDPRYLLAPVAGRGRHDTEGRRFRAQDRSCANTARTKVGH